MIEPKKLLIVRTDRIGDVVLSLPLAELIKRKYPECKVSYLVREYTSCLVKNHPFIDSYLILKENSNKTLIFENVQQIRKYNFDTCLIVYPTFHTALIAFLSGIKNRVGTGYRWYSLLFTHRIFEHRKYAEKHELEYNINLLSAFGINEKVSPTNVNFYVKVSEASKTKIENLLAEKKVKSRKPIIIIHPGSGGSAVDLPLSRFGELVSLISNQIDAEIILTGSVSEKTLCDKLVVSERIKNFSGLLTLSELTALIDKADLFIANSTGPLHIAAALNKYIIGFYPKILSCSAKRWGPYSNKSKVFVPEINCNNCTREQCEQLDCMNSININKVFSEVQNLINFELNYGEKNA